MKRAADQAAQRSSAAEAEANIAMPYPFSKNYPQRHSEIALSWESSWDWVPY